MMQAQQSDQCTLWLSLLVTPQSSVTSAFAVIPLNMTCFAYPYCRIHVFQARPMLDKPHSIKEPQGLPAHQRERQGALFSSQLSQRLCSQLSTHHRRYGVQNMIVSREMISFPSRCSMADSYYAVKLLQRFNGLL